MNQRTKQWKARYERFMERQGFFVLIGTCAAVIAGSALLSGHASLPAAAAPTPPTAEVQSAARLMQESLAEATQSTPVPPDAPVHFACPLDRLEVLRGFDDAHMIRSEATGIWAIHAGADLQSEKGAPVKAIAAGTVVSVAEKGIDGACVTIAHSGQISARYAGMISLAALRTGDPVSAGQTLGFVGNEMLAETELGPHLHLEILKNGVPVDPIPLILP